MYNLIKCASPISQITRAKVFICLIISRTDSSKISVGKLSPKGWSFALMFVGFVWLNSLCILHKLFCVKEMELQHLEVLQRAEGLWVLGWQLRSLLPVWPTGVAQRGVGAGLSPFAVAVAQCVRGASLPVAQVVPFLVLGMSRGCRDSRGTLRSWGA